MPKRNPMKLRQTARRAIQMTLHSEADATAEKLARDILRTRPQIGDLMGQLIEAELKAALGQLGVKS